MSWPRVLCFKAAGTTDWQTEPPVREEASVQDVAGELSSDLGSVNSHWSTDPPVRDEASLDHEPAVDAAGELSRDSDNANTDWLTEQPVRDEASIENALQDLSQQTIRSEPTVADATPEITQQSVHDQPTVDEEPTSENFAPESSRAGNDLEYVSESNWMEFLW